MAMARCRVDVAVAVAEGDRGFGRASDDVEKQQALVAMSFAAWWGRRGSGLRERRWRAWRGATAVEGAVRATAGPARRCCCCSGGLSPREDEKDEDEEEEAELGRLVRV